jgi:hypothetical protein
MAHRKVGWRPQFRFAVHIDGSRVPDRGTLGSTGARLCYSFYRKHGYQETGTGFYGEVETVQFSKSLDKQRPKGGNGTPKMNRPQT